MNLDINEIQENKLNLFKELKYSQEILAEAYYRNTARISDLQTTNTQLLEKVDKLEAAEQWIPIESSLPAFGVPVLFRGIISWKSKDSVSYFSDELTDEQEILEYGYTGYILKINSDYLVIQHPTPEELCSEYITHWKPLKEPI